MVASLPSNPDAARFYTLGLAKLRDYDYLTAKDFFEQAIKADPKFPLSHSMLARAWSQLGYEQKRKEEAKKSFGPFCQFAAREPNAGRRGLLRKSGAAREGCLDLSGVVRLVSRQCRVRTATRGCAACGGSREARPWKRSLSFVDFRRRLPMTRVSIWRKRGQCRPTSVPCWCWSEMLSLKPAAQDKKLVYAQARKDECIEPGLWRSSRARGSLLRRCLQDFSCRRQSPWRRRCHAADRRSPRVSRTLRASHCDLPASAGYPARIGWKHEKTGAILNNMASRFRNEGNWTAPSSCIGRRSIISSRPGTRSIRESRSAISQTFSIFAENCPMLQNSTNKRSKRARSIPALQAMRCTDLRIWSWLKASRKKPTILPTQAVDLIRPDSRRVPVFDRCDGCAWRCADGPRRFGREPANSISKH